MKLTNITISLAFAIAAGLFASCTSDNDSPNLVKDVDGNIYHTITIGTQTWMVEDLKVTHYRNGDLIGTTNRPLQDISGEELPKYQWAYGGYEPNALIYGRLYTWYAASDERGVCPDGWHLPTHEEWTILTDYLTNNGFGYDGNGYAIGKALAANNCWNTDTIAGNIGNDLISNNRTGFSALPGGKRRNDGSFDYLGTQCKWWSATEEPIDGVWGRSLSFDENGISQTISGKDEGRSIRCIKD